MLNVLNNLKNDNVFPFRFPFFWKDPVIYPTVMVFYTIQNMFTLFIYLSMLLPLLMTCEFLRAIPRNIEHRLSELEVECLAFADNRRKLSLLKARMKKKAKLHQFIRFYCDSIQWVISVSSIFMRTSSIYQYNKFLFSLYRLTIRCNSVFNELLIAFFYFIGAFWCLTLLLIHMVCGIQAFRLI